MCAIFHNKKAVLNKLAFSAIELLPHDIYHKYKCLIFIHLLLQTCDKHFYLPFLLQHSRKNQHLTRGTDEKKFTLLRHSSSTF